MNPLISVIVPIFNVEAYLVRCIESILTQTYSKLEIILVDDGSTDQCERICNEMAVTDGRIKVVHQRNAGLSAARNKGIENSHGEYFLFIDSDDYIHREMVELLYNNLIKYKADLSIGSFQTVREGEVPSDTICNHTQLLSNMEALSYYYNKQHSDMVITWNKLYHKKLFTKVRFPEGKIHEDNFTTPLLLFHASRIVFSDAKLYYYLQRDSSIMNSNNNYDKKNNDLLDADESVALYFQTRPNISLYKEAANRYIYNIIYIYEDYLRKKPVNNKELIKLRKRYRYGYYHYIKPYHFPLFKKINFTLFLCSTRLFFILRKIYLSPGLRSTKP